MWYFSGCSALVEEWMINCIVEWFGECGLLGLLSFQTSTLSLTLKTWGLVLPKIVFATLLEIKHSIPYAYTSQFRRPERPSIGLYATDSDWKLFIETWTRYKDMCRLRDPAVIRNELRTARNPEENRLLFDLIGPDTLNSATEEYLLH